MTRVAMVGRYYNRQGGVSRAMAELADRASTVHDVTVFSHEAVDRRSSDVGFVSTPMLRRPAWLQVPSFSLAVRGRVRAAGVDLVHSHGAQALGADVYTAPSCHAAWLAQRRRDTRPAVAAASTVYPPHALSLHWERRCFGARDSIVIAVSRAVKSELERHLGLDPERIRVIYNGVNTSEFRPASSRQEARLALDERPAASDSVVLLFVGYEFLRKGLSQLIQAAAGLDDVEVWVVGGDDPAPYRRLATEAGIEDRVRFLGHRDDVAPYFRAADAFVFPTAYEPFGLVITEALACGTPTITSRLAGGAELISPGREGLLLEDPGDVAELRATLTSFLEARERWPSMARAARALAEQWDWDLVWERTRPVYEEALQRRGAGSP